MKQHEHANVLRAIADGKTVQYKYAEYDADWMDCNSDDLPMVNPLEDAHLFWRVKPEPKPDYCFYAGYDGKGHGGGFFNYRDDVNLAWNYCLKITIDGETNVPKSVELVK